MSSFDSMTKEELETQIASETELVVQLEKTYPKFTSVEVDRFDRFHPENVAFRIHCTEIEDAFWRRRMCKNALNAMTLVEASV